ncbi:hypothetical protein R80B4_01856 [Fibrobacteres bacterium R8-0-B4]
MKCFNLSTVGKALLVAAAVAVGLAGCVDDSGANNSNGGTTPGTNPGGGGNNTDGSNITGGTNCTNAATCKSDVMPDGKVWMTENLNIKTDSSWCYENNADNCATYGRLYTWENAMAACPSGWRLPTVDEWTALAIAAGGTGVYGSVGTAGKNLKSTSGWRDRGNGTDQYRFSAMPGGYRLGGYFNDKGDHGNWWTATAEESYWNKAYSRKMTWGNDYVYVVEEGRNLGFSVRCIAN